MSTAKKVLRRGKIRLRIRKRITGTAERPRLSVYRSNTVIYAQMIDDTKGHTLLAASSKGMTGTKVEQSKQVGLMVAEKATAAGITAIVFDRGGYLYHGRVQALADGAREGGLQF